MSTNIDNIDKSQEPHNSIPKHMTEKLSKPSKNQKQDKIISPYYSKKASDTGIQKNKPRSPLPSTSNETPENLLEKEENEINEINNPPQILEINDLIGEKCEIDLDILNLSFNNFESSKTSMKSMGIIRAYGANTYQGLVRNYNEDRVSIIINMNKPQNYNKHRWPKTSFFGIYDGHGGSRCADFLRDSLHKLIFNDSNYPENVPEAIKNGFSKAENEFLNTIALNSSDSNEILDRSGSCAVVILIVDTKIYIANVGDSRALISMNDGKNYIVVTEDHKPNNEKEKKRIENNGGQVYQTQTPITGTENEMLNGQILLGPYRVLPGRLSVSRTIGDVEAKKPQFGGNPNVVVPYPDIFCYNLKNDNIDFLLLGCDGIYDQMSSDEILDCAWMVFNNDKEMGNINIHEKCGTVIDFILKSSMARKSFDNVTCLIVALKDINNPQNSTNKGYKKSTNLIASNINKELKISHPPIVSKNSYNSLHQNNNVNNLEEFVSKKIKNSDNIKKVRNLTNVDRVSINKKIVKKKTSMNNDLSSSNNNANSNIKKALNKSEVTNLQQPEGRKTDINYNNNERTHSKNSISKKMQQSRLIHNSQHIFNKEQNSPIRQRKSDINLFKINRVGNGIQSNSHLVRGIKYHYHNENYKSNSTNNISKNMTFTVPQNLNSNNTNSNNHLNNNDNHNNKLRYTDINSKHFNDLKLKMQTISGLNSYRNNLHSKEINSSSFAHNSNNYNINNRSHVTDNNKLRGNTSSRSKQSPYHQIISNNLNFHLTKHRDFNLNAPVRKRIVQSHRGQNKKLSHSKEEDFQTFLRRNANRLDQKNYNKKLHLELGNNANNIHNIGVKKVKGAKYINSVGNKVLTEQMNGSNNENRSTNTGGKNKMIYYKYQNMPSQKDQNKRSSSPLLNLDQ